jgi:hypothetical protein
MRYRISGRNEVSGKPVDPLIVEAEDEEAARAQAAELGTVVDKVEVLSVSAAAVSQAPVALEKAQASSPPSAAVARAPAGVGLAQVLVVGLRMLAGLAFIWTIMHISAGMEIARTGREAAKAFQATTLEGSPARANADKAILAAQRAATDAFWTALVQGLALVLLSLGLAEALRLAIGIEQGLNRPGVIDGTPRQGQ